MREKSWSNDSINCRLGCDTFLGSQPTRLPVVTFQDAPFGDAGNPCVPLFILISGHSLSSFIYPAIPNSVSVPLHTLLDRTRGNSSTIQTFPLEAHYCEKLTINFLVSLTSTRIMVSFDPDTLVSHGAPGPDISDDDLVDWDAWLTPEALHNEKYLATSQCSFINMGDCTERQHLLKHAPQLHSNLPEVPLPSDGGLQLMQSTDSNKETMTIGLQTSSPGVYAFAKCGNTEIQPIVINEKEQLKYSKPREDNFSAFSLGNHHQRRALTSPDLKLLKVQEIERETFHKYKPVDNRTQAAEYVDCIQTICQIATGETMSAKQARDVEDCGDSLITIIRSDGPIASFKSLLLNRHLHTLPRVDLTSSLAACVSYLRYLNSLTCSVSKSDDMNRRLAQIWIHIHFENHVNDLKESEKNGLPLNRQRRAIPTIARDSILQAFHGNQFVPQKTDRDYLSDQCRWGERWWKAATCMGLGVILLASEDLANQMYAHLCPMEWLYC